MASDLPPAKVYVKNEVYVGISLPFVRVVPGVCCGLFPFVSYQIMLVDEGITWTLERSYSECAEFHNAMKKKYKSVALDDFPGKMFSPVLSKDAIRQRKADMEHCLQEVLKIGDIDKNDDVRRFFSFEIRGLLKKREERMEAKIEIKEKKLGDRENLIKKREEIVRKEELDADALKETLYHEEKNMVARNQKKEKQLELEPRIAEEKKKFKCFVEKLMNMIDRDVKVNSTFDDTVSELKDSVEKLVSDTVVDQRKQADLLHQLQQTEDKNQELDQKTEELSRELKELKELKELTTAPGSFDSGSRIKDVSSPNSVKSDKESTNEVPKEEKLGTPLRIETTTKPTRMLQRPKGFNMAAPLQIPPFANVNFAKHRLSLDGVTSQVEHPVLQTQRRGSNLSTAEDPVAQTRLSWAPPATVPRDIYRQPLQQYQSNHPVTVARGLLQSSAASSAAEGRAGNTTTMRGVTERRHAPWTSRDRK